MKIIDYQIVYNAIDHRGSGIDEGDPIRLLEAPKGLEKTGILRIQRQQITTEPAFSTTIAVLYHGAILWTNSEFEIEELLTAEQQQELIKETSKLQYSKPLWSFSVYIQDGSAEDHLGNQVAWLNDSGVVEYRLTPSFYRLDGELIAATLRQSQQTLPSIFD